jgi:hypothetical protein
MRIRRAIISPTKSNQVDCGRPGADRGWPRSCATSASRPQASPPGEEHKKTIGHVLPML